MGQILIIQNKINGKSVNTIYYHWGAYTKDSISKLETFTNRLLENYNNQSTEFLSQLTVHGHYLLAKLEKGILIDQESIDLFNLLSYFAVSGTSNSRKESLDYLSKFTTARNREEANRNNGMFAVSEKDQNDHLFWSEGTIVIDWTFDDNGYPDLEKTIFDFSNLFSTLNANEYNEWRRETIYLSMVEPLKPIHLLRKNPYPTHNIPLSAIKRLQKDLNNNPHIWKRNDNEILAFIE